jgi:hypothetical protein
MPLRKIRIGSAHIFSQKFSKPRDHVEPALPPAAFDFDFDLAADVDRAKQQDD